MSIPRLIFAAALLFAAPLAAKPILTSSEETLARLCLAREIEAERIVAACDGALADATLTTAQRAELLVARGDGLVWQDRMTEAVASYRNATEIDPQSVDAWNGLGWALWDTEGDASALAAFDASLEIEASVQGLGGRAAVARNMGVIGNDEARSMLRAALAIDPDYAWAIREIGWSFLDDDDAESAEAEFLRALDIDPDDANARYGLGRVKLAAGKGEEALGHFNEALASRPDDFAARVYRIIALRKLDRNAQALRDAERLIVEFPDKPSSYVETAQSLIALQRRTEAFETYRSAESALGPNNMILYWYADALAIDGQFAEALGVIERALALDGADYSDFLMKSYIALEMKDWALARAAAEDSLATGVDDPWAHYYIAITMVHSGETAEGLSRFDHAMESGLPDDRIGAFARELISAGKYVEAAQLRLKY